MNDYSINAVITLDTSEYKKGINEAQKSTKNFSGNFSKLTKGLGGALLKGGAIGLGITAVTKGLQTLSNTVKQSVQIWEQANSEQKKLAQTLKVTGAEAWTTTEDLNAMADAYQRATNYSSNDITKMQTVLLGFKNISEDTFKSASDAILDMAEVMGMDLVSATQTVGKALDDPINGMGSLSRQGFKFSESQKELIKNLVEAGDAAKAQKIILDELNTTYGGAAKEGAKASTQLKNNWKSLLQEMGRNITLSVDVDPAIKKLNDLLSKWKEFVKATADTKAATDELIKAQEAVRKGTASDDQRLLVINAEIESIKLLKQEYEEMYNLSQTTGDRQYAQQHLMDLGIELGKLNAQRLEIERKVQAEKEAAEAAKTEAEKQQEIADREAAIGALKQKYLNMIKEQEELWVRTEKITGEEITNEEKRTYYQKQLLAIMEEAGGQITENNSYYKEQMAIIQGLRDAAEPKEASDTWIEKVRQQAIERLEAEKENYDKTVDLEKTTALQRYLVRKDYNEKIYALQREQLTYEMEKALKSVEGTANEYEEKARIVEYYNNEFEALAKKNTLVMEKEGKQAGTKFAEGFKKAVEIMKKIGVEIVKVIQGIANKIKGVFPKIKNIFEFDTDKALTNLLVFEDKILTFFVETLPKLPSFLASAMQSISVLIKNILSSGGFLNLGELLGSMLSNLINQIPQIIRNIIPVIKGIVSAILSTLSNMDIFGQLLDMIVDGFEWLLDSIVSALPTILNGLVSFVEKVAKKLPQIIKVVIPALSKVIVSIVKVLPSLLKAVLPNVLKAVLELVKELLKETPVIVKEILNAMPEIISAVIEGITEFLSNLTAKDIATFVSGVINAVIQIAADLIKNIGQIVVELIPLMAQIIIELIKSVPDIIEGLGTGVWEGAQDLGDTIWSGIKSAGEAIKDIGTSIGNGLKKLFGFATGTQSAPKGLALVGEAGPELVRFNGGEQVLNTRNTQKALAGAGGNTNNFNVVFNNLQDTSAYAMMSQLRAYNRQMAINGVI